MSEGVEAFSLGEDQAVVRLASALSGSRLAAEAIAPEAFLVAFWDWEHIGHPAAWGAQGGGPPGRPDRAPMAAGGWALARRRAGRGPAVAELAAEVWWAVRTLPRRQAQVVALCYVVDAPVAEIAPTLGMAQGTVKAQLHPAARPWPPGSRAPGRGDHG